MPLKLEQKLGKMFILGVCEIKSARNFSKSGCAKICPRENFQISRSQGAQKFVRAKIYTNKVFKNVCRDLWRAIENVWKLHSEKLRCSHIFYFNLSQDNFNYFLSKEKRIITYRDNLLMLLRSASSQKWLCTEKSCHINISTLKHNNKAMTSYKTYPLSWLPHINDISINDILIGYLSLLWFMKLVFSICLCSFFPLLISKKKEWNWLRGSDLWNWYFRFVYVPFFPCSSAKKGMELTKGFWFMKLVFSVCLRSFFRLLISKKGMELTKGFWFMKLLFSICCPKKGTKLKSTIFTFY